MTKSFILVLALLAPPTAPGDPVPDFPKAPPAKASDPIPGVPPTPTPSGHAQKPDNKPAPRGVCIGPDGKPCPPPAKQP